MRNETVRGLLKIAENPVASENSKTIGLSSVGPDGPGRMGRAGFLEFFKVEMMARGLGGVES